MRLTRRSALCAVALTAVVVLAGSQPASAQANSPEALNRDRTGLGIHGYDPVAYFTDHQAVKGSANYAVTLEGVAYRFVSRAHKDQFLEDPARYVPQYGGYCAMGVVLKKKLDIDPEAFRVVDGKLYLNVNRDIQKEWLKDIPGNIAKAEQIWPTIRAIAAAKL